MPSRQRQILKATYLASVLALGLSLGGLAAAPVAAAGEYHVYTCRTPTGEAAPADGWSAKQGPTEDSYAKDTCPEGGALVAALGDQSVHLANATEALWSLSVPTAETMVGATLWRAGDADGGSSEGTWYLYALSAPDQFGSFDWCTYWIGCPTGKGDPSEPFAAVNRVAVPSADLGSHIYLLAYCEGLFETAYCPAGKGDANGYAAIVSLYAADLTLEQNEGPIAKEASGPLATEATVKGTSDLTFNATDPGAGVWEVTFAIDGKVVQSTVPDENRGRCRNVGQTTDGTAAFDYLRPCPLTESADVGFDTTVLSNGEHHLLVTLYDPAGNSATVLDREIDVENPVPAVAPAPAAVPAKPAPKRRARARITLSVAPRLVSRFQSIRFSGRLLGESIPRRGKRLVLELRQGRGRWLKFDAFRTGAHGRFHGSYRFQLLGPGRWQVRVLCAAQAGYPFATGWSRVVEVRVA
jgi:hypothetical protein